MNDAGIQYLHEIAPQSFFGAAVCGHHLHKARFREKAPAQVTLNLWQAAPRSGAPQFARHFTVCARVSFQGCVYFQTLVVIRAWKYEEAGV